MNKLFFACAVWGVLTILYVVAERHTLAPVEQAAALLSAAVLLNTIGWRYDTERRTTLHNT